MAPRCAKQEASARSKTRFLVRDWIALFLLIASFVSSDTAIAAGSVKTDGTIGAGATTIAGPVYQITPTYGQKSGNNLFFSFGTFNIGSGETANFNTLTLPGLADVIARITGGPSTINGILQLTPYGTQTPGLFLIDPAGVTFGAGASVNVPGAFHVSTANLLRFDNGDIFYSSTGKPVVLSIGTPSSFGFLGTSRATIVITGGAFLGPGSGPISVSGGDITISGSSEISSPSGNINIAAVGNTVGDIPLAGPLPTTSGTLSVTDGSVIQSFNAPGGPANINVSAGAIALNSGSIVSVVPYGASGDAPDVSVNAAGSLSIRNGGEIASMTYGTGDAGAVHVTAGSLNIRGSPTSTASTGILSNSITGASGNGGDVLVNVTGHVAIVNGQVAAITQSSGNAGSVSVSAGSMDIVGPGDAGSPFATYGISSSSSTGSALPDNGGGKAGNVQVAVTGNLSIANGAYIESDTSSNQNAGSVNVSARSMVIDGDAITGNALGSGVMSDALGMGTNGNGGAVQVSVAQSLTIMDGGGISSDTLSNGAGGSVKVSAGSMLIDGLAGEGGLGAGISSNAASFTGSGGPAGSVQVAVSQNLSLIDGGAIYSVTGSRAPAGTVSVTAGSLLIEGTGPFQSTSGISTQSDMGVGGGNAGSVNVVVRGNAKITSGGLIDSDTYSTGSGGTVKVTAQSLTIDGLEVPGDPFATGISSNSYLGPGGGNAGSVQVAVTQNLALTDGGAITTNTSSSGRGGIVKVNAGSLSMDGMGADGNAYFTGISSGADQGSTGNAGDIDIAVPGAISIDNGAQIATSTFSSGNAGLIKLAAGALVIDGQRAAGNPVFTGLASESALGASGNSGDVSVTVMGSAVLVNGGQISTNTFSPGSAGNIELQVGTLSVAGPTSSISAFAGQGSSGQTGDVIIGAKDSISLSDGALLSVQNYAVVTNPALLVPTELTLSASDITLKNAQISAQSFGNVNASDILVQFSGQMVLDPSSIATSANLGNGGSITIRGGQSLFLDNSSITTSVGGAAGNGGDITIATGALASNTGFVQANTLAEGGVGGLVNIEAGALLASGNYLLIGGTHPYTFDPGVFGVNVIQAAAPDGLSGTIDLSTPQLDIAGLLESLKAPPPTPSPVGKNPCQFAGGSSFTLAGTGGMALSPTDMLRAPEAIDPTDRDDAKHPGGSSSRKATPVRCHS